MFLISFDITMASGSILNRHGRLYFNLDVNKITLLKIGNWNKCPCGWFSLFSFHFPALIPDDKGSKLEKWVHLRKLFRSRCAQIFRFTSLHRPNRYNKWRSRSAVYPVLWLQQCSLICANCTTWRSELLKYHKNCNCLIHKNGNMSKSYFSMFITTHRRCVKLERSAACTGLSLSSDIIPHNCCTVHCGRTSIILCFLCDF